MELSPCPFCGHTPLDLRDAFHPTATGWRDDNGRRRYMHFTDPRGIHGHCWGVYCLEHEGGCGAQISGDSKEEAEIAWNRRPVVKS